jgi:hypothetical protein
MQKPFLLLQYIPLYPGVNRRQPEFRIIALRRVWGKMR